MEQMKLIYHDETAPLTYEQAYKGAQEVYGAKHPEEVSGFAGFFFRLPDIYAYGRLGRKQNEKVEAELQTFIRRFMAEDYGFVTPLEHDNNVENRWLCGTAYGAIARYSFEDKLLQSSGGVVLEFFKDIGIMYYVNEDMTEIYAKYKGDPSYEHQLVYYSPEQLEEREKARQAACQKSQSGPEDRDRKDPSETTPHKTEEPAPERKKEIGYRAPQYSKTEPSLQGLPEFKDLFDEFAEKAKHTAQPCWYVKGATLYFTYKEKYYEVWPGRLDCTGEVFEELVDELIDRMYELGAYDMFYAGMMD